MMVYDTNERKHLEVEQSPKCDLAAVALNLWLFGHADVWEEQEHLRRQVCFSKDCEVQQTWRALGALPNELALFKRYRKKLNE